jgi:hypothetical protein
MTFSQIDKITRPVKQTIAMNSGSTLTVFSSWETSTTERLPTFSLADSLLTQQLTIRHTISGFRVVDCVGMGNY